ncbi:SDR family NAD(P)-dependent oxidoreductase [Leifsonia sp. L25]|uniref:SDR family NAD(P)-dependent oxidoreductase n=1 Tax=Actinomycetes TaxID=1760 RepID=UPI003D699152
MNTTANTAPATNAGGPSTALVTGATSGIGKEIARQLAAQGWNVLLGARDRARGEQAAAEVGGAVLPLDVTDADSVAAAAAAVPALDVLINNAGISLDIADVITDVDVDVFRRTYETNVFGVVAVTNAFAPALRRSAHPRIVNISSGTGSLTWSTGPNPQFDHVAASSGRGAAYRSSKAALDGLTIFYAHALAADGVKVNALAPGLRATNLNPRAAAAAGDPAEAAEGAVRLATLPDDGPSGLLFSWDGTVAPW